MKKINNEFYTLPDDVVKELELHKDFFKNKVVYCNCDDVKENNSSFYQFFISKYFEYKLKSLITTHYPRIKICFIKKKSNDTEILLEEKEIENKIYLYWNDLENKEKLYLKNEIYLSEKILNLIFSDKLYVDRILKTFDIKILIKQESYKLVINEENINNLLHDHPTLDIKKLFEKFKDRDENYLPKQELINDDEKYRAGDFRSNDCIDLLKIADIVVTNPPFSIFREFMATMYENEKDFILISPFKSVVGGFLSNKLLTNELFIGFNQLSKFRTPNNEIVGGVSRVEFLI
ncbi:MAG: adenine-specific methyltransferase EcoRI family protein [Mycoplasmoidaceae bacterium]